MVSRYRPLWRNRCRSVSHGPRPLLYQSVLVKYPYVEPELTAEAHRHPKMAAAKAEDLQRAFAVCCIRCPCPCLTCLGCILPFIGLQSLRFYAVASSLFLLFVGFCLCFLFFCSSRRRLLLATFLSVILSTFPAYLQTYFRFGLVWFRLSCDHGRIRSGSINMRYTFFPVWQPMR